MPYLLDTNVISELRKKKPHGAVVAWFSTLSGEEIYLSAVTVGELQAGIEITRRQDRTKAAELEKWLDLLADQYQILPMDARSFREWARLMDRQSDEISEDAMLAATARVHRLTLATRNTRDFRVFDVAVFNPFTHAELVQ